MKSRPGVSKIQRTRSMKIQSRRGEGVCAGSSAAESPLHSSFLPQPSSAWGGEIGLNNLGMKGEWRRRKWCFPTMVGLCAWRQQEQCFGLGIPEKATLSSASLTVY